MSLNFEQLLIKLIVDVGDNQCFSLCKRLQKPRDSTVPSVTLQGRGENNRSAYGTDKPKAIKCSALTWILHEKLSHEFC